MISNSIALEGKDYYDLHNCYSLKEFNIDRESHVAKFVFEKVQGDWVSETNPQTIEMVFSGVSHFETSQGFLETSPEDIEEMGYKNEGDFDYDWLLSEEQAGLKSHFVFRFLNDQYIRVFADMAEVIDL